MIIRNCTNDDIDAIRQFVDDCKPLTLHTPYTYHVMFTYFQDSCFVMEDNNEIVGYISGMKSAKYPDVFFIWQIGVSKLHRGKGYSKILVKTLLDVAKKYGCTKAQFTIEPENCSSFNTFDTFAKKKNMAMRQVGSFENHDTLTQTNESETVYELNL